MTKKILTLALSLLTFSGIFAQESNNNGPFRHLAFGFSVGTGGFGLDLATTLSDHFTTRLGFEFFPPLTIGANISTNKIGEIKLAEGETLKLNSEMTFDVEPHVTAASLVFDYYPMTKRSFFISAGFYLGSRNVIRAENNSYPDEIKTMQKVYQHNQDYPNDKVGILIGDKLLYPDAEGKVKALFKAKNAFQPYIGIGYGRAVPKYIMSSLTPYQHRISYMVEFGLRYWGKPTIYCNDEPVSATDMTGVSGMLKTLSTLPFYPELKVRLSGKFF